jgi:hypothetical protein
VGGAVTRPDPALDHDCPFCAATVGAPCRSKFGKEREWTHIVRRPASEQRKRLAVDVRALCCECGNLRTVSSRFRSRGCIGDLDDRHPDRRMIDMLACSVCGQETRHARLRDDYPDHRDAAEERDHKELAKRSRGLQDFDDYELLRAAQDRAIKLLNRVASQLRPTDFTLEDCYRMLDTYMWIAADHGLEI